jgi:hypothetical protein
MGRTLRLTLTFIAAVLCAASLTSGREPEKAAENKMKLRNGPMRTVLFELTSNRGFPVINARPVMVVGSEKAILCRSGKDGNLNTLIFWMTAEEFAKTKNGDPVRVRYEPDSQGTWEFGKLDKKVIEK